MASNNDNESAKKSLLDIQAEQANEQRQQQQRQANANNMRPLNSRSRGLSPKGGGGYNHSHSRSQSGSGGSSNQQQHGSRSRDGPRHNHGGSGTGGGGGGGRRPRGSGGGGSNNLDPSRLPLEQGVVCTLKESFGFIHCADRPEEIFFHYSQVENNVQLQRDDPVEFRVNSQPSSGGGGSDSGNSNKVSALQVRKLDTPIAWETEDEPGKRFRGLVERATRFDRGNATDGTIRMLIEKTIPAENGDAGGGESVVVDAPEGPLVRFTNQDYQPPPEDAANAASSGNNNNSFRTIGSPNAAPVRAPNRLSRGDLVEFTMVTMRRSKDKYARNITLLLSEKERQRQEQEQKMLEAATVEHGVVTALKGEYGFLRSNKRREEVYFHYSSVHLEETEHGGDAEVVLKEGQEMKFLVVEEGHAGEGGGTLGANKRRVSARQVQMQPRGSVKFHDALACGVTGIVIQCPQPIDAGHSLEHRGKVRLFEPIVDTDGEGNERTISEVYLSTKDSPGGTFAFRGGSAVACWVQEGDVLLFDVVKDYVDGACHASPTKHEVPNKTPFELEIEDDAHDPARRVRLIELAWIARAEGVVNAVKESYGFIHFAERPVDVHFKLYQILPEELQKDIRRNMGLNDFDGKGKPLQLTVGAEVQFDISVHGKIHTTVAGKNHRGRHAQQNKDPQAQERENLKAQRVLLLPPGTIQTNKILAKRVRGVVTKEDLKQPYAGSVDLDESVKPMTPDERHPLVAKMIDTYLASDKQAPIIFHDVQSQKEEDTIVEMVELRANGKLTYTHLPDDHHNLNHAGKMCIAKKGSVIDDDIVLDDDGNPVPTAQIDQKDVASTDGGESGPNVETDDENELVQSNDEDDKQDTQNKKKPSKKKKKPVKLVKSLRFDKSNLSKALKDDAPPAIGDIVEVDVVQSRRTGQVSLENMTIIQRHVPEVTKTGESGCVGVVKEVVVARNFGFISVLDETAANRESIFFSLANVVGGNNAQNGKDGNGTSRRAPPLKKGDEVKFEVGVEKNGKRVALNVTLLPKGTIPNAADKNACRGYVLLQPSHTTLANSPVRHTSSSDKLSRWDSGEEENKAAAAAATDPSKEKGCILLLEDPTNAFAEMSLSRKPSLEPDGDHAKSENNEAAETGTAAAPPPSAVAAAPLLNHLVLHYNNGALAIHGSGSAPIGDNSAQPRRGDLVSFFKAKSGKSGVRDVRIVTRGAATLIRGRLEDIELTNVVSGGSPGRAKFISEENGGQMYDVDLRDVIGCDLNVLKEKEAVEGLLHDGGLYGICRTVDLYLESKVDRSNKLRPKLNLTVKKDRGGKIMAQSMMAKGPDGTPGFASGWTTRVSKYAAQQEGEFHVVT